MWSTAGRPEWENDEVESGEGEEASSDDSSSDEEPPVKIFKDDMDITKEEADQLLAKAGTHIESVEEAVLLTNVPDVTNPVTIMIMEAKADLRIKFILTEGQLHSLYAIASFKDTIIVLPCGDGKMLIFYLGLIIVRKVMNRPAARRRRRRL
jgi:hypothetical protein